MSEYKISEKFYAIVGEFHGKILLVLHRCLPINKNVYLNYNEFEIFNSKFHLIFNSLVLKTPFSLKFGIGKEMKVDNSAGVFLINNGITELHMNLLELNKLQTMFDDIEDKMIHLKSVKFLKSVKAMKDTFVRF